MYVKARIMRNETIMHSNIEEFNKYLSNMIQEFQRDGLDVEVQFNHDYSYSAGDIFTALIIGRGI